MDASPDFPIHFLNIYRVDRLCFYESAIDFLRGDREFLDPYADSIGHGIGDGRCDRPYGVLPNTFGAVGSGTTLRC